MANVDFSKLEAHELAGLAYRMSQAKGQEMLAYGMATGFAIHTGDYHETYHGIKPEQFRASAEEFSELGDDFVLELAVRVELAARTRVRAAPPF